MKEKDYLLATNLARIRMAEHALRHMMFMSEDSENALTLRDILSSTVILRERLENEIDH